MSQSTTALDNAYSSAISETISSSTGSSEMDKQAFLMLLVTQFKYQDPLNPMEDKEFVAQLAQFSSLEQNMNMNENLASLIEIQQQQTVISAASYIGKEISARGYGLSVENGQASTVQFASDVDMTSCYVNILDTATKTVLATVDLGRKTGGAIHEFNWDAKLPSGGTVADGVYTISFSGKDANGETVMIDTSVTGRVNGVSTYNGTQYLRLDDGRTVTLANVREILETKSKTDADSSDSDDSSEPDDSSESDS